MKKAIRIVAYCALSLVTLMLLLSGIDVLRYSLGKPTEAETCNYEGKWQSETYPIAGGRILVDLPSPMPIGEPFKVKAFVYYKVTGFFRMGSFIPMEMEAFVDGEGSLGGDNSEVINSPRVTFKFKSGTGSESQQIDYVSTTDVNFNEIVGGYRSSSPNDMGVFSLRKVN